MESVRTTCPRDCYDACGITVTFDTDGSICSVRGDTAHPVSRGKLCRKCTIAYNGVFLDTRARLTRPLVRTGPKGSGSFREASWDEALALVASRLSAIRNSRGGHAITYAHYTGTVSLLAYWFPMRLMRRLGATEIDPDTVCNKAGHVALEYLYGTSVAGFDPRTVRDARCIAVWGCNPSATAPHADEHWLGESRCVRIVVDPIRTDTAKRADIHLQARPGTDAALAFALLHVLRRDGLLDRGFLADHTVGWDEVEDEVARCDPDWGESTTGVPAALIVQAARAYGNGPSLLWIGQGLQRQPRGGNLVRAVGLLPAATGNLGRPGAGFLYLNGAASRGLDESKLAGLDVYPDVPAPISHMELADHLADPARAQALVCFNINIAASNPDQERLREALLREDLFTVVADIFPTDTAECADVVLPAASFLEFDDLVASYFHRSLSAQVKTAQPPGEALPNMEIFRRLATALGLEDAKLHESDASLIDQLLAATGTGLRFDELAVQGTVWRSEAPEVQFEGLNFPTPSGLVEIASARAERDGHGRVPRAEFDIPSGGDLLRLISPASPWLLNSSFSNEPKIRKRLGPQTLRVHPSEAARRSLIDGADVLVESATGQLRVRLEHSDDVPPGVAYLPKGRWPKHEPEQRNVNVLNPSRPSDIGASATFHATEVTLSPVG